jgi:hypothetical protein
LAGPDHARRFRAGARSARLGPGPPVEGRFEVTASPLGREQFAPPSTIDPGPASYPGWAVGPANGPPLAWTSAAGGRVSFMLGGCERGRGWGTRVIGQFEFAIRLMRNGA